MRSLDCSDGDGDLLVQAVRERAVERHGFGRLDVEGNDGRGAGDRVGHVAGVDLRDLDGLVVRAEDVERCSR